MMATLNVSVNMVQLWQRRCQVPTACLRITAVCLTNVRAQPIRWSIEGMCALNVGDAAW